MNESSKFQTDSDKEWFNIHFLNRKEAFDNASESDAVLYKKYKNLSILELLSMAYEEKNDDEMFEILKFVWLKVIDLDNSYNRHSKCSPEKCLRRSDGSVSTKCK